MNQVDVINKLSTEAKVMHIIRQLTIVTQDVRQEDVEYLCDKISNLIENVTNQKHQRKITLVSKLKNLHFTLANRKAVL
jgi:hypothetical protein